MNPKQFQLLQKKWYKKLKDSGFKDIESDDNKYLKKWDGSYFIDKYSPTQAEAIAAYYRLALQFLEEHEWSNPVDRRIWELHSLGRTAPEIAEEVKEVSKRVVIRRITYYSRFIKS